VIVRTGRVEGQPRYGEFDIEARAEVPAADMTALMEQARRLCWVSNTVANGVELSYRYTEVDSHTQR
jgi:hypothetical protein